METTANISEEDTGSYSNPVLIDSSDDKIVVKSEEFDW